MPESRFVAVIAVDIDSRTESADGLLRAAENIQP